MTKILLITLLLSSLSKIAWADAQALDSFATTRDHVERSVLFERLLADKSHSAKLLSKKLEACFKKRDELCGNMEALLYLASALNDKSLVPILTKMLNDDTFLGDACIYCCGITIAMSVYGLHGMWSPPTDRKNVNAKISDAASRIKIARSQPRSSVAPEPADPDNEMNRQRKQASKLKTSELIAKASAHDGTYESRLSAAEALSARTVDSVNRVSLYKALLDPFKDDSGEFVCFISDALLSVEARASRAH